MSERFCINCKHSRGDEAKKMQCASPHNSVDSVDNAAYLVTGEVQPVIKAIRGATCKTLRGVWPAEIAATVCGPEGKWFEAKEQ